MIDQTIIDLRHVRTAYPGASRDALRDVSLSVPRGQYLCVLGANGSGKSTLLQIIGALMPARQGAVSILGFDPMAKGGAISIRKRTASVFQHPEDQMVTSIVADDVAFGPENLCVPSAQIAQRVEGALAAVDMGDHALSDPADLSGGQKQRVAIAGALAMKPDILLLDEPAAMLDTEGRRSIQHIIDDLRARGITIVHVTHFMDDALRADRVVVLHEGAIALDGTPNEVFSHRDRIRELGLEAPFALRLAERLEGEMPGLPLTADAEQLARAIAERLRGEEAGGASEGAPHGEDCAGEDEGTPRSATARATGEDTCAIVFADVSFSYAAPARRARKPLLGRRSVKPVHAPLAIDKLAFEVGQGTITALIGATGSGKSTTVELACALKEPLDGTVYVRDIDTSDLDRRRELRRAVGYVSQLPERQLFAETVFEDVAFGPRNLGIEEREVRSLVLEALKAVGMDPSEELLARSPFSLSGGQARYVAIAGVLAMDQPVLILDEPMAGLDPAGRAQMRHLMRRLKTRGTTLLFVTHDMDDVAELADRAIVLERGRLAACGTPAELFEGGLTGVLGVPNALAFDRLLKTHGVALHSAPLTLEHLAREVIDHGIAR